MNKHNISYNQPTIFSSNLSLWCISNNFNKIMYYIPKKLYVTNI